MNLFFRISLLIASTSLTLQAHPAPTERIESLSKQLATSAVHTYALIDRGYEYLSIYRYREALSDFQLASALEPQQLESLLGECKAHLAMNESTAVIQKLQMALLKPTLEASCKNSMLVLLSLAYEKEQSWQKVLAITKSLVVQNNVNIDTLLRHSLALHKCQKHSERRDFLIQARVLHSSVLLDHDYIDTLIDLQQWDEALPLVEAKCTASRWKSSWWIRRAQIYFGLHQDAAAKQDLSKSLEELLARLNQNNLRYDLWIERALTLDMLDRRDEAKHILTWLIEQDVPTHQLDPILSRLKAT